MLHLAAAVQTPKFIPDAEADYIAKRTCLRVPPSRIQLMPRRSATPTVWLVQLAHLKVCSNQGAPIFL